MGKFHVVWVSLLGLAACHPDEAASPQQAAAMTRQATARCEQGDGEQCATSCKGNGPNSACRKACDANDGSSCMMLGTRLERGVDVADPESVATKLPDTDDDGATTAYERACRLGAKEGCRMSAARILNGQGRGNRPANSVTELLKYGCSRLQDADSCCMMAQLNYKLAQARQAANVGINFRAEGKKWASIAVSYGGECPAPPGVDP